MNHLFKVCLASAFLQVSCLPCYGQSDNEAEQDNKHVLIVFGFGIGDVPYDKILDDLKPSERSLILPSQRVKEEDKQKYLDLFCYVRFVEDYEGSGEVELAASEIHKKKKLTRIIAPSEREIMRVAELRTHLEVTGQSYESAQTFRDKLIMKEIFKKCGVPTPEFSKIDSFIDILKFSKRGYPFLIKPRLLWGAEGVRKIKDDRDIDCLSKSKIFNTQQSSNLLAESYVEGAIYHIDGLVDKGRVLMCWPSSYFGTCFEYVDKQQLFGHLVLAPNNELVPKLTEFALNVLAGMDSSDISGFHLEVFHTKEGNLIACEIGSRIGGGRLRDMWLNAFNIDLGREYWRHEAGLPYSARVLNPPSKPIKLSGGVFYPKFGGELIAAPKECPFEWVTDYEMPLTLNACYERSGSTDDYLASAVIEGVSDRDLIDKCNKFKEWLDKNVAWKKN